MTKLTQFQMTPETSVTLLLKSFKIQAFANPRYRQAIMLWIGESLEFFRVISHLI